MATYDMTAKATTGVNSDSIAEARSRFQSNGMYMREAVLDFDKMTAAGWTAANGDIFQLLEIPADTMVLFAGAYVEAAADGTSPTVDIDFAAGTAKFPQPGEKFAIKTRLDIKRALRIEHPF